MERGRGRRASIHRRHSAQLRRVAPFLRFLTGSSEAPIESEWAGKEEGGEDMEEGDEEEERR